MALFGALAVGELASEEVEPVLLLLLLIEETRWRGVAESILSSSSVEEVGDCTHSSSNSSVTQPGVAVLFVLAVEGTVKEGGLGRRRRVGVLSSPP